MMTRIARSRPRRWLILPVLAMLCAPVAAHADVIADQAPAAATQWWRAFGDARLDALIARVHTENTTIRQAAARVDLARARDRAEGAATRPRLALSASASDAGGPLINAAGDSGALFSSAAQVSWEADVLGRLSGARRASRSDSAAAAALLRHATLLMEAETARSYLAAGTLGAIAVEAERRAALAEAALALAGRRLGTGLGRQDEVDTARRQCIDAQRTLAAVALARQEQAHRLAFLAGGDAVAPGAVAAPAANPSIPAIPDEIPAQVLARRPDVEAALLGVEAADARLVSARRSWLPSFSLTASGGVASPSLGAILGASAQGFGLGLLLALPVFDGGRHRAQVAGGKAELALARARYGESMLGALREVSDALGAVHAARANLALSDQALAMAERAESQLQVRRANGTVGELALLQGRIATSALREERLRQQLDLADRTVMLVKALGGGWGE